MRLRLGRRTPTVLVSLVLGLSVATAGLAPAADAAGGATRNSCGTTKYHRAGTKVQYCGIWSIRTDGRVPVYANPYVHTRVGWLWAGYGNWFVDQEYGPVYKGAGYSSRWYARTMADNGRWGYVPGVYFTGVSSKWTGLTVCRCGGR